MIQVPESIKELYHRDTCKKNIRIHFPNGERSDICNNLIVKDSVSFTESLCSQDTLKFGLCESPVFECETVGVGNIKGATIEVFCEIYCDPSITGAEWKVDLQDYVYAIQYGTFVVDSCKSQGDIIHRKIVAYGTSALIGDITDPIEQRILTNGWISSANYTPKAFCFAIPNLNCGGLDDIFEKTEVQPYETEMSKNMDITWHNPDYPHSGTGTLNMRADVQPLGYEYRLTSNYNYLYSLYVDGFESCTEDILDWLVENYQYRPFGSSYTGFREREKIWDYVLAYVVESSHPQDFYKLEPGSNIFNFYPYLGSGQTGFEVWVPTGDVVVSVYSTYPTETYLETVIIPSTITTQNKFYKRTLKSEYSVLDYYLLNIPKLKDRFGYYSCDTTQIPSIRDILDNSLETIGRFGRINRRNEFELLTLKRLFGLDPDEDLYPGEDLYPQGVTGGWLYPEDYQSCWYDDEYTKPFGAVVCNYKNTSEVDSEFTLFLPGYSLITDPSTYQTYKIQGNLLIDGMLLTQNQAQAICESVADSIVGVSYMPVDFVGRGLPYVEAGDTFEILTKSNESITTIVLNRTITGEQTLTDSYKSVGE